MRVEAGLLLPESGQQTEVAQVEVVLGIHRMAEGSCQAQKVREVGGSLYQTRLVEELDQEDRVFPEAAVVDASCLAVGDYHTTEVLLGCIVRDDHLAGLTGESASAAFAVAAVYVDPAAGGVGQGVLEGQVVLVEEDEIAGHCLD